MTVKSVARLNRALPSLLAAAVVFAALSYTIPFLGLARAAEDSSQTPEITEVPAVLDRQRAGYLPDRQLAYIANVAPPTITVVDLESLTILDSIVLRDLASKFQSHTLAVTPDGKQLWIGEDLSPDSGFIQVIDLPTGQVLKRWDVGAGVGSHITRDGRYLFTSSTKTNNINVFDVVGLKYLGDFPVDAAPHAIDSSPDGRTLWTNDQTKGNLLSFDMSGLPDRMPTLRDSVPIGGTLHALLVHPNGKYVFVGSDLTGSNIVDTETKEIVAKAAGKPHNYELSPDRNYLLSGETGFVTGDELKDLEHLLGDSNGPLLRFVNVATLNSEDAPDTSTIRTEKWLDASGIGPASISHQMYDPTGKYLLVTTYRHTDVSPNGEGELLIVNADSLEIERVLPLPARPHGISVAGVGR